jgi:predicted RNase H-like nuclease
MHEFCIIGIDCSTSEKETGLALGFIDNGKVVVTDVELGSRESPSMAIIENWLEQNQPALLAFDAPLGWPVALGQELIVHSAGMPIKVEPDFLFSRYTDRTVQEIIKKRPLEVGANWIARTAHAALKLLGSLRQVTGLAIPLAWEQGIVRETCAIEVYPSATLIALDIHIQGYKKPNARNKRISLVKQLERYVAIANSDKKKLLRESPDAIDAVVCALAASDFISRKCIQPDDEEKAKKEGWIWVRNPMEV